jgi:peptidoglycan/LPS O-acetylase OafA/YrhL
MANRLLRIYPLYLVLVFIALSTTHGSFTMANFARLVLPLSSFGPIAIGGAWGEMFWAVAVEVQFYLLFPLLLRLLNKGGPVVLLRIIAAMFALRVLAYLANPDSVDINGITYYSILGRLDQFLLGMIVAWVFIRRPSWLGFPTLLVSSALAVTMLWSFNQAHGYAHPAAWRMGWVDVEGLVWAAFLGSYVTVFASSTGIVSRLLARLGEVSYSLYLLHFVVVTWVASRAGLQVDVGGPITTALATAVIVVLPITFALAFVTYQGIERPFLELRLKYLKEVEPVAELAVEADPPVEIAGPRHR